MLGIGRSIGWTAVLLVMIGVGLIFLVELGREPLYTTTGSVRVSPVIAGTASNDGEGVEPAVPYENYKSTVASRLTSSFVLNTAAGKLEGFKLDYFGDTSNRAKALGQAIKNRQIVIDNPCQSERIMIRMTSSFPSDAETIVNCLMDSCVAIENAKPPTLKVLEDQRQKLLLKMEQPDQKDRARGMYNEVTRRIQDIEDKSRRPVRVQIDSRAQTVPEIPHQRMWFFSIASIEVILVLALIANLVASFRPPGPYKSNPDNT